MSPGLTIGAVLTQLREEFPDLTVSKVRFLDAQELVSPQRSESGYRRYTEQDVERLRFVLRAQRDRFWPLKVIREALDAYDRGLVVEDAELSAVPSIPQPAADADVPTADELQRGPALELTREELQRGAGASANLVSDLETFGLVKANQTGHFTSDDLTVAKAAAALAEFGVQARHLRPFRLAADREIGLIEQVPTETDEQRAALASHLLALHIALVKAGLRG